MYNRCNEMLTKMKLIEIAGDRTLATRLESKLEIDALLCLALFNLSYIHA